MSAFSPRLVNIIYQSHHPRADNVLLDLAKVPEHDISRFEDHLLEPGVIKINGVYHTLEFIDEDVTTHGQQIVAITRRFVST